MTGIITAVLFVLSCISAIFCCRTGETASALMEGGNETVLFCMKVCGSICLFSGLLKVAEKAGLTKAFSRILRPVIKRLMPLSLVSSETEAAVCLNISSNMLGLGNAATPFGIKAARNMYTLNGMRVPDRSLASFIVLNTASVCFFPSGVIALRQAYGAADPYGIILPVLFTQMAAAAVGLLTVRLVFGK